MELLTIGKIVLAIILLLLGISFRKAYKSTGDELSSLGDQDYAKGFQTRRTILFILGNGFIILSLYLFYIVIFAYKK